MREARDIAAAFDALVTAALQSGEWQTLPDEALRQVLTAAVKAYAAKAETYGEFAPFEPDAVTATETVVTTCAMIRAADLNLFDMAMWFRRPTSDDRRGNE